MPHKDKEARNAYQRARHARLRAEDPEAVAKSQAYQAAYHAKKQATDEAYRARRKTDKDKWYAEFGKERARELCGYKPLEEYLAECEAKRKARNEYMKEYQKTENGQRNLLVQNIKHKYGKLGITIDDYERAYEEQEGKCRICGVFKEKYGHGRLAIDHCHKTGKFRALLCTRCNSAIGMLGEDPDVIFNTIVYLEKVSTEG